MILGADMIDSNPPVTCIKTLTFSAPFLPAIPVMGNIQGRIQTD
jgi:hypothetical protein